MFDDAMSRLSALDWPAVAAVYDFAPFTRIVDVGGGHGQLLALALAAALTAEGVLFERAGIADRAERLLRAPGVVERTRFEAGSLFATAPTDGDLYVLRRVLHDFADADALAILTTLRRHMPPGATLLVIECVVPPGTRPHLGKLLDLDMLLFVGGRERTEPQWRALLAAAGLRTTRVVPTVSPVSLIEASPEW